jgi:glycosyltransferase involved in cell wall biosynthesis
MEVSIVMAVYQGEKYLAAALESVFAQTFCSWELIVVNDGSKDRSEEIVKRYDVRYFYQENRGQPAAQNFAIRKSQGRYIAFLDADDLYSPEKTALQVDFLEKNPKIDFVFGSVEQFISPELSGETKWLCPSGISPGYLAAAGLFRKECFDRVGLFNEEQRIGPFIEWYMRAEEKGLCCKALPELVLRRRIHENNMGLQKERMAYVQIVREALKRRARL